MEQSPRMVCRSTGHYTGILVGVGMLYSAEIQVISTSLEEVGMLPAIPVLMATGAVLQMAPVSQAHVRATEGSIYFFWISSISLHAAKPLAFLNTRYFKVSLRSTGQKILFPNR